MMVDVNVGAFTDNKGSTFFFAEDTGMETVQTVQRQCIHNRKILSQMQNECDQEIINTENMKD